MTENTLIDRYLHEVGQHLPKKMRADIQLELRSTLEDMLEENGFNAAKEEDNDAISQLLINFGHPEDIAGGYLPKRSLVGPELFPAFMLALKIAIIVLLVLLGLDLGLDIANNSFSWNEVADSLAQLSSNFFQMFGVVLFVFILLEQFGAGQEEPGEKKDWDPQKLPKVDDPSRIKRTELIVSLIFTSAALVIFNFFPEIIGVYGSTNGEAGMLAHLAPEFSVHIPWLSVFWALQLGLRTEVLRRGIWSRGTRLAEITLSIFGLFVLYRIVIDGPILTMSLLNSIVFDGPILSMSLLNSIVKGVLTIVLVVTIFESLSQVYRLISRPSAIPNQIAKNP